MIIKETKKTDLDEKAVLVFLSLSHILEPDRDRITDLRYDLLNNWMFYFLTICKPYSVEI